MEKKRILLTAGGTATTWHFCQIIKEYFDEKFEIHICDINEDYLVPASIYAFKFHKVPSIYEDNYEEAMFDILEKEKIDIIVPLIDFDLITFSSDNIKLKELGVVSTAPCWSTLDSLTNKLNMYNFLKNNSIPTPEVILKEDVREEEEYIIKPVKGFGSNGVELKLGKDIRNMNKENFIIQEKCLPKEITAEIYNGNSIKIFQRERVATKAGVCTKMVPVNYEQINKSLCDLIEKIECPRAFCVQFMQNTSGEWCIVDCNLRIGAGTALSTKIGFQLVRALLADLCGEEVNDEFFEINNKVKSVLRVYEEIVIE